MASASLLLTSFTNFSIPSSIPEEMINYLRELIDSYKKNLLKKYFTIGTNYSRDYP